MASFRETREALLLAFDQNLINDEEFVLLYDLNRSKNPDYPYWNYERFDLDKWTDAECKTELRFYKTDVYRLADALNIPEQIYASNRSKFDGMEAFCVFLKRFSYPNRQPDLIPRFGRAVPELSMMSTLVQTHIYTTYNHLLHDFNHPWLTPVALQEYSTAVHEKRAPLQNCFAFIDGTVRPLCKPGQYQRVLFNGHKRVHAIKFQSVVTPNGLISNLHGPVEGKRHDSGMLAQSGLLPQLQQFAHKPNGEPVCIYGDDAYPLQVHLQGPFKGNRTPQQDAFNTAMSNVRVSVEWLFKEITTYFAFLDFKKNLKIGLSAVGKMYIVCALMTNARTCLYSSQTSDYFGINPPMLEDYFYQN